MKIPKAKKGQVLIVRVGSDEQPASAEDLKVIQMQLAQAVNEPNLTIVTHHCVEFEILDEMPIPEKIIVLGNKEEESK